MILLDSGEAPLGPSRSRLRAGFCRRAAFRLLTGTRAPRFDGAKLWDVVTVERLLSATDRSSRILDCGGFNSPSLRALALTGFRDLHGIDLNPALSAQDPFGPTRLTLQDMQATAFNSGTFDVLLSASTVEHGVDWARFISEAARLLRPRGLLYVSTDLVHEDVDPSSVEAFGLPWRPLRVTKVPAVMDLLEQNGFLVPPSNVPTLPEILPHEFFGVPLTFIAFVTAKRA